MTITGHCHCSAIEYAVSADAPLHHALCHCGDCRRHSGAPMVGWIAFPDDTVSITKGAPKIYRSSDHGERHFCGDCGTGLLYRNGEMLPGITDIQSGTLDDPEAMPPQAHIQTAERLGWMETVTELPSFERYPG